VNARPTASGFACPSCGQRQRAYILSKDTVHILELECADHECQWRWAVELVVGK
jgi:hypothetical protein